MHVKLESDEIDELISQIIAPKTSLTFKLSQVRDKLARARVLADMVGDSFIDPKSKAAKFLASKIGVEAPEPAPTPPEDKLTIVSGEDYTRARVEELRAQQWPNDRHIGAPPFGWLFDGEKLIPNVAEQLALKHALLCRNQGYSFAQVAADLNGRQLRTRRGSKWNGNNVRSLLQKSATHPQNTTILAEFGPR